MAAPNRDHKVVCNAEISSECLCKLENTEWTRTHCRHADTWLNPRSSAIPPLLLRIPKKTNLRLPLCPGTAVVTSFQHNALPILHDRHWQLPPAVRNVVHTSTEGKKPFEIESLLRVILRQQVTLLLEEACRSSTKPDEKKRSPSSSTLLHVLEDLPGGALHRSENA